jgi:4-hydroxyphenylacetate 3-monooxygenase
VLIDPPVDRHKARIDVRDVYLSVDRDDDKGIYVSGAKMVATGSALTHATFVAVNSGTAARMEVGRDEDMALVFLIEMNAAGLKLITRPSYEHNAASPFDAPLASRFDEGNRRGRYIAISRRRNSDWRVDWHARLDLVANNGDGV